MDIFCEQKLESNFIEFSPINYCNFDFGDSPVNHSNFDFGDSNIF